ncbi:MAG: flagellar biosynthetic protein FliQ [Planctomycetota bacterium]|jgi:flagellar biosynthetic protein FliQ
MLDDTLIDSVRLALMTAIRISAPMLVAGVIIGLAISIVQSVTSIQDQTLTFVPKILGMIAVAIMLISWLAMQLAQFTTEMFDLGALFSLIL